MISIHNIHAMFPPIPYYAGWPIVEGATSSSCVGQPFYLSCLHPYTTNYNVTWTSNGSPIDTSDVKYTVYGEQLEIKNVTKDLFSNVLTVYKCIVLYNGVMISGRPYFLHPIGTPYNILFPILIEMTYLLQTCFCFDCRPSCSTRSSYCRHNM